MVGRVLNKSYSVYNVLSLDNDKTYALTIRGSLKRNKNVFVGDIVVFDETENTIEDVKDRKNFLIRPSVSYLDFLVIVSSLKEPVFSYDLMFKYLTYTNSRNIKPVIVISKIDLSDEAKEKEIKEVFDSFEIPIYFISSKTKEGVDEVRSLLRGNVCAFMGQSGVGKSSLLNALDPSFNREEGEYSYALGRGKHQTKETILFPFNEGFIADTPGFSSLELNLKKEEIAKFFPRFEQFYVDCEFFDCLHIKERNCKIKQAFNDGILHPLGYSAYLKLIEDVDTIRR